MSEIKVIKIDGALGKEAVARAIGDAIANEIGTDTDAAQSDKDSNNRTEYDDLEGEALDAALQSDDFKNFKAELQRKISDLVNFVEANRPKYGCAVIVGATAYYARKMNGASMGMCGRQDSLTAAVTALLREDSTDRIINSVLLSKILS